MLNLNLTKKYHFDAVILCRAVWFHESYCIFCISDSLILWCFHSPFYLNTQLFKQTKLFDCVLFKSGVWSELWSTVVLISIYCKHFIPSKQFSRVICVYTVYCSTTHINRPVEKYTSPKIGGEFIRINSDSVKPKTQNLGKWYGL